MIHPIPPGTRDILPDEMRELRELERKLLEAFTGFGYGEVGTPTIEYDEVLARGDGRTAGSAYRFFDERGDLLALRSDMTIPIARLVAGRYGGAEPPFRLCYISRAYRAVRPQRGQMREFTQAGVELIGTEAPEGTAEVVEVLQAALDAVGLGRAVIGLGDADLYRQALAELGIEGDARDSLLEKLARHDLVGLQEELELARGSATSSARLWSRSRSFAGAARSWSRPARSAARRWSAPSRAFRAHSTSWSGAARRSGCRSTSACCATSATTAARSSRSTTRPSAT